MNIRVAVLFLTLSFVAGNALSAPGDLVVNGTLNVGTGGVAFPDSTVQKTAAFQVLAEGEEEFPPGQNSYTISLPSNTGKVNLSYEIYTTSDVENIMVGFNDNITATGSNYIVAVLVKAPIQGKIHLGYGRKTTMSSGQFNSYDIIPSGNLIIVDGRSSSENTFTYFRAGFGGYLKYGSPQTISKINFKTYYATTYITKIKYKVISIP